MSTAIICANQVRALVPTVASALMTPVLGRPAADFLFETLASAGIDRVILVDDGQDQDLLDHVAGGERWGLCISQVCGRTTGQTAALRCLIDECDPRQALLVVHDDPIMSLTALRSFLRAPVGSRLAAYHGGDLHGYGWLTMTTAQFQAACSGPEMPAWTTQDATLKATVVGLPRWRADHLLELHQCLLEDGWFAGSVAMKELSPGVLVGPRVWIDPTATVTPPCSIGDDAWIGAGARIGPNTTVGPRAVIADRADLQHTIVTADAGVPAGLRSRRQVLSGNGSADLSGAVASAVSQSASQLASGFQVGWGERICAIFLVLVIGPWRLLLRQPATPHAWPCERSAERAVTIGRWDVVHRLLAAMRGRCHLFGAPPIELGRWTSAGHHWQQRLCAFGPGVWGPDSSSADLQSWERLMAWTRLGLLELLSSAAEERTAS